MGFVVHARPGFDKLAFCRSASRVALSNGRASPVDAGNTRVLGVRVLEHLPLSWGVEVGILAGYLHPVGFLIGIRTLAEILGNATFLCYVAFTCHRGVFNFVCTQYRLIES